MGVGTPGAVPCVDRGVHTYQLLLPVEQMVVGVPAAMVPSGLPANYQIDLFALQQSILLVYLRNRSFLLSSTLFLYLSHFPLSHFYKFTYLFSY